VYTIIRFAEVTDTRTASGASLPVAGAGARAVLIDLVSIICHSASASYFRFHQRVLQSMSFLVVDIPVYLTLETHYDYFSSRARALVLQQLRQQRADKGIAGIRSCLRVARIPFPTLVNGWNSASMLLTLEWFDGTEKIVWHALVTHNGAIHVVGYMCLFSPLSPLQLCRISDSYGRNPHRRTSSKLVGNPGCELVAN